MSNTFDANKAIIEFYNDENLQKIKQYYERTTIFNVLKIERNENRHSAFICWLLDIHGSHKLGEEPLRKFLRVAANETSNEDVRNRLIVGNYKMENFYINTEESVGNDTKAGRIDIYVKFMMVCCNGRENSNEKAVKIPIQVIIENKIYTSEHDAQTKLYHEWAIKQMPESEIIGVFLSPEKVEKCDGDCDDFKYAKMDYETLLYNVIEPLLGSEMTSDTEYVISDYIINLGQPATKEDDTSNTILAIRKKCKLWLDELYNSHKVLLTKVLCSNCKNDSDKKKLEKWLKNEIAESVEQTNENNGVLEGFWEENIKYMRLIFENFCERFDDEEVLKDTSDDIPSVPTAAIKKALDMKTSNRDTTKYYVYGADGKLMYEKGLPKSKASFYIFKAWLDANHQATLNDLRKAFSIEAIAKDYYGDTYQYFFYRYDDIMKEFEKYKGAQNDYVIAPMDETESVTKEAKKYIKWDFFKENDAKNYKLETADHVAVLNIKMWHKEEFDALVKHAKQYGIVVTDKKRN